jgi:O-antigen ligase
MVHLEKSSKRERLAPTLVLVVVVLLASWMGDARGGYFVGEWAPVTFLLAALAVILSATGVFRGASSPWGLAAVGLLAGYAAWTFASLLWSPNRGDAWVGASQTLVYLLAFGVALALTSAGASRRWVLAASVFGPAVVAAFTLPNLVAEPGAFFDNSRLIGTVGYYNGEAAFLLVPLWVAVYLAGSRRVNPFVRGASLAAAVLCAELAFLTQSRGAMVALVLSAPVYFLLSGQRLRGLLALAPVVVAGAITLPGLNGVYLAFLNGGSPAAALDRVLPLVWVTVAGAGLYGLLWGLVDRRWSPPVGLVRAAGAIVLAGCIGGLVVGGYAFAERAGNPVAWGEQRWEAFKNNDAAGQEQSRYLSASGSGRYTLWEVARDDFASRPLLGVGTHNYEATYYQKRERSAGYVRQPHMLPLEVLAERGLVGGVLFFGFLGTCLAAGLWKRFQDLRSEGKAQVGALVAALAYWFVHSSAEWFWQIPAVTLPAIVYLAMLVSPWDKAETEPPGWPLRLIGAGVALLAIAVVAPLYVADRYLARSYATENPWVAMEAVERAQTFNPVDPQLPQREADLAMRIGDWPRARQAYERAIRLNPEHYAPYTLLAKLHEQRGEPAEALSLYREALALNPLEEELNEGVRRLEVEGQPEG